ncbi:MAG: AEC family transporter [Pseudomonadota bacterium]
MYEVLGQMVALIACGVFWRVKQPFGLAVDIVRRSLTGLVYVILLPALVLMVLWEAPLDVSVIKIALVAGTAIFVSLGAAIAVYRWLGTPAFMAGALVLASAFPNATYLGLPVLESTLGEWARSVAIQYDLFACTPILLSLGVWLASRYGGQEREEHALIALLKVPPLWAAVIALALNLGEVPMPKMLHDWLQMLGGAVVPLMLIALGMGLCWTSFKLKQLPLMLPAFLIQLLLMPLYAWWAGGMLGIEERVLAAVVLEAAMPSMILGMVLCDRYNLDTKLYVTVVTLSTLLSLITLPLWFAAVS